MSDFNDSKAKKDSYSWKQPNNFLPLSLLNFDREDEVKDKNKEKSATSSTLSLHIAAYENSVEEVSKATPKKDNWRKKSRTFNRKWESVKQFFASSPSVIQNPFEFPRQQENNNLVTIPEVAAYEASQRVLNPDQSVASDESNTVSKKSKYDDYFIKLDLPTKLNQWKCKNCSYKTNPVKHTSTSSLDHHLENKHKRLYIELTAKTTLAKNDKKRPNVEPRLEVPSKQLKISDGLFRETNDTKSREIDKRIMEMIAIQNLSFSFVDGPGFRNVIQLLDPRYKMRGRKFFSNEKLPEIYEKLKLKIKDIISKLEWFSIVIDEWADEGNSHVLLGITIHFLNGNFEPKHFVSAAEPVEGAKNAANLSRILNEVFVEFNIDKKKIAYMLRDGASVVVKIAKINDFDSEHCLAHGTQLVIGDAKKEVEGLETVIAKVKKLIKKLKKSGTLKQAFHEYQKLEDLHEKNLEVGIDIRWNSLYMMLKSFYDNKKAIQLLCIEEGLEDCSLSGDEWKLVQDFVETLKVFYSATLFLQRRDTTISYVIPIIKAIQHDLEVKEALGLGNKCFIDALLRSLNQRFASSLSKKNLIIATLLDPRFKLDFLDESMIEDYKKWIIEEIVGKQETTVAAPEVKIRDCEQEDLFSSYLKVNKLGAASTGKSEVQHLVEAELVGYIHEPTIGRDLTAGNYWKINSGRFPYLSKLYCKHATAPATSAEAERLFSIAGMVLDEMRRRLNDETIKKLLFLNCNLKLLNYDY